VNWQAYRPGKPYWRMMYEERHILEELHAARR
jgi:hypothetical protein